MQHNRAIVLHRKVEQSKRAVLQKIFEEWHDYDLPLLVQTPTHINFDV